MAESPWEHLVCFQQEAEPFPLKLALLPGGLESASPGPPVLEEKPAKGMKSWWLRRRGLRRRQAADDAQTTFLSGLSKSHSGLSFLLLYLSNAAVAVADNARGCSGTRNFTQEALHQSKACSGLEGNRRLGQGRGTGHRLVHIPPTPKPGGGRRQPGSPRTGDTTRKLTKCPGERK